MIYYYYVDCISPCMHLQLHPYTCVLYPNRKRKHQRKKPLVHLIKFGLPYLDTGCAPHEASRSRYTVATDVAAAAAATAAAHSQLTSSHINNNKIFRFCRNKMRMHSIEIEMCASFVTRSAFVVGASNLELGRKCHSGALWKWEYSYRIAQAAHRNIDNIKHNLSILWLKIETKIYTSKFGLNIQMKRDVWIYIYTHSDHKSSSSIHKYIYIFECFDFIASSLFVHIIFQHSLRDDDMMMRCPLILDC